jgi:hypothetical protein
MLGAAARTCDCAVETEQGWVELQAVPAPFGETQRTIEAAAAGDVDWTRATVMIAAIPRLMVRPRLGRPQRT